MQIKRIVTALAVFGLVFASLAPIASAGTKVFNRHETTNIYNGYSETDVNSQINTHSITETVSKSIKAEAYGGDINITNVSYDGEDLTGNAHSSNQRVVDPVSILTVVEQHDYTVENVDTTVDVFESNYFDGTIYEHTVGNSY